MLVSLQLNIIDSGWYKFEGLVFKQTYKYIILSSIYIKVIQVHIDLLIIKIVCFLLF